MAAAGPITSIYGVSDSCGRARVTPMAIITLVKMK